MKLQQDEFRKHEGDLGKDKRTLKQELKEQELANQDTIRALKLEHSKEITKLRQEFDLNARELQQKYEKKMKLLRDDLELRRKQEIHEIEERKNTHINDLMKKHERAFAEIKNYYNDITHNNLDLIKTLKEDVAEMKKREAQNEKLMYEIAQENKRLSEPLTKALKEVELLRQQLANYEKVRAGRHLTDRDRSLWKRKSKHSDSYSLSTCTGQGLVAANKSKAAQRGEAAQELGVGE